ncbi:hypothetical protein HMPREF1992_01875 [Selenomonas sp. oral taxon 892 str. F0426]|uniref:hypothetical protein n=1 Tax=Selenomonas sp. oral taxon 892 TaxID=1321785 RepID=UPI0003AD0E38|nr:hypothetical protein [Selenomonas sp. oral taxon 892]ERJ90198.1 hypothetical protein HMPREF1992_01875 [Selenomonas sp. oral taxon 892 str. F0426]
MSSFLSGYLRQIGRSLLIAAALGVPSLLFMGEVGQMLAFLAGSFTAALYFWQLAQRLLRASRASRGSVAAGRRQVQIGLVLMLTLIFAVLWAASTVGVQHFYAAVGGFLLVHFVMMAHLILREMRSDKQNGDFPQGR